MQHSPDPKTIRVSLIQLAQMMMPALTYIHSYVRGGWIMNLADEGRGLASTRHAAHLQKFNRNNGISKFILYNQATVEKASISFTSG
jgi:hypothetical protein